MLALVDVAYIKNVGIGGLLTFETWTAETPIAESIVRVRSLPKYVPGEFYKRELPVVLEALRSLPPTDAIKVEAVVLDGYVWLDGDEKGVGAYLFDELGGKIPVIGVAKTIFAGGPGIPILRGGSQRPLNITAAGIPAAEAAALVQSMHGPNRIPTLLKRVETLSRKAAGIRAT